MKITRREAIIGNGCSVLASGLTLAIPHLGSKAALGSNGQFVYPESIPVPNRSKELAYLSPFVDPSTKWGPKELFKFLNQVSEEHLVPLGKALEIEDFWGKSKPARIEAIHNEILWQSSSILTYPFKSAENINYHEYVVWCIEEMGATGNEARFTSTFDLEKEMFRRQFINLWDMLGIPQRKELLEKIDVSKQIKDVTAIVAVAGAAALPALLSTTVYFSGFAFYTTMTVVISTVASWFGVVLPFTAYMAATSTVAALSGPIGWAICAVLAVGTIATWAGQANVRKTTAIVMQLHCMKAGALYGAGLA